MIIWNSHASIISFAIYLLDRIGCKLYTFRYVRFLLHYGNMLKIMHMNILLFFYECLALAYISVLIGWKIYICIYFSFSINITIQQLKIQHIGKKYKICLISRKFCIWGLASIRTDLSLKALNKLFAPCLKKKFWIKFATQSKLRHTGLRISKKKEKVSYPSFSVRQLLVPKNDNILAFLTKVK